VARWRAAVGGRVRLENTYGPTEATVVAAACDLNDAYRSGAEAPIGRPLSNVRLYVLYSAGQPAPLGVAGELHIGGDGLARGYLRRPGLTAEKFVPDAFSGVPGARLYKTGDLVRYLPDGKLEFVGRCDGQVKVRGFRIEPGEIEAVLVQHPGVKEAVVLLGKDAADEARLVAYLVVAGDNLSISELRSFLRGKLPGYMVPAHFVVLEQLPLMPNGKLDRRTGRGLPGAAQRRRRGAGRPLERSAAPGARRR
jgi:acyl-CoA synthetase (AMP-forming)/AMP-acid ligase II